MEVASLCPLPVGVVSWQSPGHVLTVVVKATLSLGDGGRIALAPVQEPLSLDRPSPLGADDELEYASDFSPLKARADVVLVGHANAESAALALPARIAVDDLRKSFFAVAGSPSTRIPLTEQYLRDRATEGGKPLRVGPQAPWSPQRSGFADSSVVSPDGPPSKPLTSHFDFRFYNVAPPDQQLDLLRATATVALEGLLPGGRLYRGQLPALVPKVFHLARGLEQVGPADPVALRCDTLWFDTDRARCTLTWRGVLVEQEGDPGCLVVSLQQRGEEQPWRTLKGQLDRATFSRAIDAAALRAAADRAGTPSPHSARKLHDVTALRRDSAPPSQTRSMILVDPARPPAGRAAERDRLAERLRTLRAEHAATQWQAIREEGAAAGRGGIDDRTIDAPYAVDAGAAPRPGPVRDEGTVSPDTAPATSYAAEVPNANVRIPTSERTVTIVHNPLYPAEAAEPPGPRRAPPDEPPSSPDEPARPRPPAVADDPTLTMGEDELADGEPPPKP